MADPPSASSLKVTKRFTYRGVTKDWSNRYFFDGSAPADSTHWTTLSDAVVTAEKACFKSNVTIVGTTGYEGGSEIPVFSKTYTTVGTYTTTNMCDAPGDCAILIRWSTGDRTAKNHPLYLFNYMHGVTISTSGPPDTVKPEQVTAVQTYASSWLTGFSDGAAAKHRCGPFGNLALGHLVNSQVHHRDFPNG